MNSWVENITDFLEMILTAIMFISAVGFLLLMVRFLHTATTAVAKEDTTKQSIAQVNINMKDIGTDEITVTKDQIYASLVNTGTGIKVFINGTDTDNWKTTDEGEEVTLREKALKNDEQAINELRNMINSMGGDEFRRTYRYVHDPDSGKDSLAAVYYVSV